MAFQTYFTFFALFFFSFHFLSTTTLAASPHVVVFDIRNDLPYNALGSLAIRCDEDATAHINVGVHYKRTFQVNQSIRCVGSWSNLFNTWDGYKENRDVGHSTIYWSVRKDGFYHSLDGSNYKLLELWQTE
jgi:hypothetical protein